MPIPKKWKIVSGGLSAAVALGAGVAIAGEGGEGDVPELDDVVTVQEVESTTTTFAPDGDPTVTELDDHGSLSSPFAESEDATADESGESVDSNDSAESTDSGDSNDSVDPDDSADSDDSGDSADSEDSTDSEDSAESADS